LFPEISQCLWPRWRGGKIDLFFVTVLLQRFNFMAADRVIDRRELLDRVRMLFARDPVHYVGFLEFAMVNMDAGPRGHQRFDLVSPHAHLLVWVDAEYAAEFKRKAKQRGRNLQGGPNEVPIVKVQRVKRTKADFARVVCYMVKSQNYGNVIEDGEWLKTSLKLESAGYLDQFRIYDQFKLPDLMLTKGEGAAIRGEVLKSG
jgi:hypothetical protein